MYDVAWRGMWICVRSKDAQKQLARTSLTVNCVETLKLCKCKNPYVWALTEHLSDFLGETEHFSGKKWSIKVEHFSGEIKA